MSVFPKQKVTTKEREKRDKVSGKTWGETSIDYLLDDYYNSEFNDQVVKLFRFVDGGELIEKDYEYVLNPMNTTVDRYKRFGAKLKNFDIITPVKNLYVGEFTKRFKNVNVIDSNPDDDNRYKEGLGKLLEQYYNQQSINEFNALGIQTGKPTVEQQNVEQVVEEFNVGFDSQRVISGQEILDYIVFDQDLDEKYTTAYENWITCGATVTYKGIFNDDIDFETVPPEQINTATNDRSPFLEDKPWITRKQVMTVNEILDRWNKVLTEDQVEWLEAKNNNELGTSGTFARVPNGGWISSDEQYAQLNYNASEGLEVGHGQWRSFKKVGLLSRYNELGEIEEIDVDDTYKLETELGDISIEWHWESIIYECWRIGDWGDYIYLNERELPYNRMELNNHSTQKLSYNGRVNINKAGKLISLTSVGEPYQILFNILAYQREKVINKNKDKVIMMPQGLIPKGINGWDEEKHMYYMDAAGYMVYDETAPTAPIAINGIKVLDMSLNTYINDITNLMGSIRNEFWESAGMNRQRYGDTLASDGKGATEQAIFRSSIISEELNRKFEKFQEKDYEGILDLSKLAFLEGKKAKYINSDKREAFLDLNPDNAIFHLNSDYNIHVVNSSEETEKIQTAKEYGFSLGQNADAPSMMELIGARNFEKTKKIINEIDQKNKQREQEQQEQLMASNEKVAQMTADTQKEKTDVEYYKADKEYDKAIDVKLLEINEGEEDTTDTNNNDKNDKIDYEKLNLEKQKFLQSKKESNQKIKESNAKIRQMNKPQNKN